MINPATIQLKSYEVIINLTEIFFPHLNLALRATFSKAGAELGTAQPQLVFTSVISTTLMIAGIEEKNSVNLVKFINLLISLMDCDRKIVVKDKDKATFV